MSAGKTQRRSTEEVRRLILGAAAAEFTDRGFADTTMRSVAARADISLSVLYRQFVSKERLFAAALLEPFLDFFEDFGELWSGQIESPWDDERLMRETVRFLYDHVSAHRHTLMMLLAATEGAESDLTADTRSALNAGLEQFRVIAEHEARQRGSLSEETVGYANLFVISLISGLVMLGPLLFESDRQDRDELIPMIARYAMHGMKLAPPEAPTGTAKGKPTKRRRPS